MDVLQITGFQSLFSLGILHKVRDFIIYFAYIYYGLTFWKKVLELKNNEFYIIYIFQLYNYEWMVEYHQSRIWESGKFK